MKAHTRNLPLVIVLVAVLALLCHGPIEQYAHYHEFADQTIWMGMPHATDVLSNLGFALVAMLGASFLVEKYRHGHACPGFLAFSGFVLSLFLTALGSTYYHLAPDDARLLWDRLPIALACCSLLAAVRAENLPGMDARRALTEFGLLLMAGLMSVIWWQHSGDLRPYLLLQGLTIILIPLWQSIYGAAKPERLAYAMAMILYIFAKITESQDAAILAHLHIISGHSLKHILAALAAGVIVFSFKQSRNTRHAELIRLQKIEMPG
ncbi:hypothetical protein [Undibacterium sp. TJN19]|uniref:hypothetical protein n=1 Tax=Undibacterium sp. TJN19 TaxID=3413055 RepID=UPI003BEFB055